MESTIKLDLPEIPLYSYDKQTKKKFFLPCYVCFGYGYIDPFKDGLRSAGIYSYTLVVPNK